MKTINSLLAHIDKITHSAKSGHAHDKAVKEKLQHTDDAVVRFRFPACPLIHCCHPGSRYTQESSSRASAAVLQSRSPDSRTGLSCRLHQHLLPICSPLTRLRALLFFPSFPRSCPLPPGAARHANTPKHPDLCIPP